MAELIAILPFSERSNNICGLRHQVLFLVVGIIQITQALSVHNPTAAVAPLKVAVVPHDDCITQLERFRFGLNRTGGVHTMLLS